MVTLTKVNMVITLLYFVGMTGFEPAASPSLTECANRTAPHPDKFNPHYAIGLLLHNSSLECKSLEKIASYNYDY